MRAIPYNDQIEIFDPAEWVWPIHVIGLGGIGSALLLPLVKLGVREIHLWDDDEVEPHNVPAQLLYRRSDVGRPKVEAAAEIIESYGLDVTVIQHPFWVTPSTRLEGVVLSGVDSMTSRRAIWEAIKFNPQVPLYLDGRIGGEQVQTFSVDPVDDESIDRYEPWLVSEADVVDLPCSARTIIHSPLQVAVWMIEQLTLYARGELSTGFAAANLRKMQYVMSIHSSRQKEE